MKYMLLIYGNEKELTEEARQCCYAESVDLVHELVESGHFVGAAPLHDTATASSLRIREGKQIVTDGPFAETHEQLGGFYMVEAKDMKEALSIAARIPPARWGTVEVRPVVELPNMPK